MLVLLGAFDFLKKYKYMKYQAKWYMVVLFGVSELIVEVGQSWGAAATARYPWICYVQLVDVNHLKKYIEKIKQIH